MIRYLLRRMLYTLPILFAVNLLTFALFFVINTPDDMARMQLGQKYENPTAIHAWKVQHGYDLPLFYNPHANGVSHFTETLYTKKSIRLFMFDFGLSDVGRDIGHDISQRLWPSLVIALPVFVFGLLINLFFSLLMVFFRDTSLDYLGTVGCIIIMSVSEMFYIIAGQFWFGKLLHWVPISGYDTGLNTIKFIVLPVMVAIVSELGSRVRWYRSLFLEELNKNYVLTARAKGLAERFVLFKHVLRNAWLPILTGIVVIIPSLFLGSLILESFFSIPGLGNYLIDAIRQQDFATVRAMVFLGSVLYIIGLMLTDITYTWVDPRVRLG